jgi:uncharacterized membrane protein
LTVELPADLVLHAAMTAPLRVLADGPFDTVASLPLHPLVVHAAVVLLPLAALGLVVLVLVPRWRATFGWLVMAGLAAGTVSAIVAKQSGEALAARVGEPQRHAQLGDVLPPVAIVLLVVAVAWFVADRRRRSSGTAGQGALVLVLGIASAALAVGTVGLTVAVGHSGAEAVWAGDTVTAPEADAPPQPSSTPEPTSTPETPTAPDASAAAGPAYTIVDVSERSSAAECWAAVDGTVYDLTAWIAEHPGGAAVIEGLCGTDATAAFRTEHGSEREPNAELAQFAIGSLVSSG